MKVLSQGVMKLSRLQASAPPPLVITIPHSQGCGVTIQLKNAQPDMLLTISLALLRGRGENEGPKSSHY